MKNTNANTPNDVIDISRIIKITIMFTIFIICIWFLMYYTNTTNTTTLQKIFKENGILICHNTLIIANSNWKLNQDKLTNNNSAGYVSLENCRIQ